MPKIESLPRNIHIMHAEGAQLLNPHSDDDEATMLIDFMRKHAGDDAILIIDLAPNTALYANAGETQYGSRHILEGLNDLLKSNGIGVIFVNLEAPLENILEQIRATRGVTFAETIEDATALADMLQSDPARRAAWIESDAPDAVIHEMLLDKAIGNPKCMQKNTYHMLLPWEDLHSGHIAAMERVAGAFVQTPRKVGEKRTLIIDLSNSLHASDLLMPALERIRKQLDLKGDSLRVVCKDAVIEAQIDEHPKTRDIPIFTTTREAASFPVARHT